MRIGELAKTAQCSVETIRYYEKEGLLPKPARRGNNYRFYSSRHLQQLLFVRNCRALDLSQEEIGALLGLMDQSENNCGSVNALLDEHISHVDTRLVELQRLKNQLTSLRQKCRTQSKIRDCRILQGLSSLQTPGKSTRSGTGNNSPKHLHSKRTHGIA